MLLVDYNNKEWIEKFITDVLSDDDFGLIFDDKYKGNYVFNLAKKAGYTRIEKSVILLDNETGIEEEFHEYTYVYINENGKIEEDRNFEKFEQYITRNKLFIDRLKQIFEKFRRDM